jgi:hypothetical protein
MQQPSSAASAIEVLRVGCGFICRGTKKYVERLQV